MVITRAAAAAAATAAAATATATAAAAAAAAAAPATAAIGMDGEDCGSENESRRKMQRTSSSMTIVEETPAAGRHSPTSSSTSDEIFREDCDDGNRCGLTHAEYRDLQYKNLSNAIEGRVDDDFAEIVDRAKSIPHMSAEVESLCNTIKQFSEASSLFAAQKGRFEELAAENDGEADEKNNSLVECEDGDSSDESLEDLQEATDEEIWSTFSKEDLDIYNSMNDVEKR